MGCVFGKKKQTGVVVIRIDRDAISYFLDNQKHRVGGPAVQMHGFAAYYQYNELHRPDGPAIQNDGVSELWYLKGKKHRFDGPAEHFYDGDHKEWHLFGKKYATEKEWQADVDKMVKVKKWILFRHRTRTARRFIRFCDSGAFWEPGGMGYRWAKHDFHNTMMEMSSIGP
jgi:hypothetical protein